MQEDATLELNEEMTMNMLYEKLGVYGQNFRNVRITVHSVDIFISFLLIHRTGFYVIQPFVDETLFIRECIDIINFLQKTLDIDIKDIHIFGIKECDEVRENDEEISNCWCFDSSFSMLRNVDDILHFITDSISFSPMSYSSEDIDEFVSKISRRHKRKNSMTDSNGREYVLKRNQWYPLSDIQPDSLFYKTLFGGLLGFHKFELKQYAAGIAYLLTFGLFGVGWLFDCLLMVSGSARIRGKSKFFFLNREEKSSECDKVQYIRQVSNPIGKMILVVLMIIPVAFLCFHWL